MREVIKPTHDAINLIFKVAERYCGFNRIEGIKRSFTTTTDQIHHLLHHYAIIGYALYCLLAHDLEHPSWSVLILSP